MSEVGWAAVVGGLVLAVGLVRLGVRRERTLIGLGPVFYAAPLAAFGSEHFTLTAAIAGLVPAWMPWPELWTYAIGAGFIAAALAMVTGVLARPAALAVAVTFFLFVATMDAPAWVQDPHDRIALVLALRELSFCGGALALAATHRSFATIARYFIAIPVVVYSVEQLLHGDRVPAIPLELATPAYIPGHAVWTYATAVIYAVAGVALLAGRYLRTAAIVLGATVLVVVLAVYVPMVAVERATLESVNFLGDTLMYCGALLLLAGAIDARMPAGEDVRSVQARPR